MFKPYYCDRFRQLFGAPPDPTDGPGDAAVHAELDRAGLVIPRALFDYYALAGRHPINEEHNHVRPISQLEWMDDMLVFLDENQAVVYWGIRREDVAKDDPIVWQGVNVEPMEWYSEERPLSRFLMAMWTWIVTGEEEPRPDLDEGGRSAAAGGPV